MRVVAFVRRQGEKTGFKSRRYHGAKLNQGGENRDERKSRSRRYHGIEEYTHRFGG